MLGYLSYLKARFEFKTNSVEKKLIKERKLILIVDLDETVVSTGSFNSDVGWLSNQNDQFKVLKSTDSKGHMHLLKKRPHLTEFLSAMAPMYKMYVCTSGRQDYAQEVLNFIDPNQEYFEGRIASRNDINKACQSIIGGSFKHKSAWLQQHSHDIALRMTCIIDDKINVWPQHKGHVCEVDNYKFMENVKNTLRNSSLDEHTFSDEDMYLLGLTNYLTKVNKMFYKYIKKKKFPKMAKIISAVKKKQREKTEQERDSTITINKPIDQ